MLIKGWPQQKILIIKWTRWLFYGCQLVSFSIHPCYCPMSSWTKWPWWQRWRLIISSTSWPSTHQGWLGHDHCWGPNLPTAETNIEYPKWHHCLGWSANYLGTGWLYYMVPIMEGTLIYSYWNRYLLLIQICLFCTQYFCQTECLIHQHGIAYRIASGQRTHFTVKDVKQWPMFMEFTGLTMLPNLLKQLT